MSTFLRTLLRAVLHAKARLTGRAFVCRALQGESNYNIAIQCDMTVACNCQDDGSGQLGSLRDNTFEEIFFGPKAESFRAALARGKLPILICARCGERQWAPRNETAKKPVLPKRGLLVENTVACNLRCPGCIRASVAARRKQPRMSLDDIRAVADLVRRLGIETLYYFDRGEPFLSPDIRSEIRILREQNPDVKIVTSTNGMMLDTDDKREAALAMDEVVFSIDGSDQASLEKYQRGGDFDRMVANLRALVKARDTLGNPGPRIEWKYLLFSWNDRPSQIQRAVELAREAGADRISFWPTNDPWYGLSWRYRLGRLNHIGTPSWKGRELILRPA